MTEFKLPDIGEGIVECEVVEWRIQEGDVIEEDQPVVEVMTDKALVEITAPEAGRVTQLHVPKGEIAKVHAPLFAYEAEAEGGADTAPPASEPRASEPQASEPRTDETATTNRGERARPAAAGAAKDFILPDIGEGIVECEVVEWRIAEGEAIEEDQPVVDVMTDKAMVEITAPEAGRVTTLHVAKGEIARVHAPLFAYAPADADTDDAEAAGEPATAERGASAPASTSPAPQATTAASPGPAAREASGQGPHGRIPASPAVRRLLREHGLRLGEVPGSGKQGRVLKEDVQAYLARGETTSAEVPSAAEGAAEPGVSETATAAPASAPGEVRVEPMRGIRAAMARKMVASASTIPHFQYGEELDVTELLALRERLKPEAQARDARLTLMPFFMKAMALAIRDFPILNSRLNEAGDEIHYLPSCNIGMAVDGKAGLMVPNVKGVERLSLLEIAGEIQRLTAEAREGRVASADLQEGTISISNIGALGGTYAAPIINAPEVAIVAIGKTQWLPRFDADDNVVKRAIMTVTWAGDHRLIDGGTIARFCNAWKSYLEAPETMLLHLG
ncbi:Dihydrolipoyllysine-residue acetyltransferase component of pyruvate dehydrogenase complex [Halomonas sp. THAF5a]|uniref:dihydrolipoyllysine-residue acetyltransferase n=1 Tax=Halomonas sp. THAF5a TaxID=2587844 RepID=UPI0012684116|nr:dihydrolipoyllysine-residue acetyltransferase [Halomonas sp. THAF5a]QFU01564.1 Dihydrolipoyllysine-residue acetyltransferase component of pyruvate dehydrogenase complex [Halomonas sp. THAF5a]